MIAFGTALFTITNPIGNTAIFASMTGSQDAASQAATAHQSAFAIIAVLLIVLWVGHYLLDLFGTSIPALETAGELIVLSLGLSMLHSEPSKQATSDAGSEAASTKDSIAVVPIAIPIVAGPTLLQLCSVSAGKQTGDLLTMAGFSAVCIAYGVLFWVCFYCASRLSGANWGARNSDNHANNGDGARCNCLHHDYQRAQSSAPGSGVTIIDQSLFDACVCGLMRNRWRRAVYC